MSRENFMIWSTAYEDGVCVIEAPSGVKKSWQLCTGMSRAEDWPKQVICEMSDEFPDDISLVDNLHGAEVMVVSEGLKRVVERLQDNWVEFLPVRIRNHKSRTESAKYFIMNPLGTIDCIDLAASELTWNNIAKDEISACEKLVILDSKVPPDRLVFRLGRWPEVIIAKEALVNALAGANLKGLHFTSVSDYRGI